MIVLAGILIAIGCTVSLLNWWTLVATIRGGRFVSVVPLVGAVSLGSAMLLLPQTRGLAWIAPLVDYGTLVLFIALPRLVTEMWSTSRFNLLHSFDCQEGERYVKIDLFRRDIAAISGRFDPPRPCNENEARVVSFGLVGKWRATEDGYSIEGYGEGRRLVLAEADAGYAASELQYPSERESDHDRLDGLTFLGRG